MSNHTLCLFLVSFALGCDTDAQKLLCLSFFQYKRICVSDLHQSIRCAMSSAVFVIGAERNMVTLHYTSLCIHPWLIGSL